jgi:hypothetical protein
MPGRRLQWWGVSRSGLGDRTRSKALAEGPLSGKPTSAKSPSLTPSRRSGLKSRSAARSGCDIVSSSCMTPTGGSHANSYRAARVHHTLGGAVTWPLAARAQGAAKLPTIGFLGPITRSAAQEWIDAFELRLRDLGWIDGRTVTLAYRWVEGRDERFAEIAAELVRLKVDVIVTSGTPAVMALQRATSVIPIVFATAGDPVTTGLVAIARAPPAYPTARRPAGPIQRPPGGSPPLPPLLHSTLCHICRCPWRIYPALRAASGKCRIPSKAMRQRSCRRQANIPQIAFFDLPCRLGTAQSRFAQGR